MAVLQLPSAAAFHGPRDTGQASQPVAVMAHSHCCCYLLVADFVQRPFFHRYTQLYA